MAVEADVGRDWRDERVEALKGSLALADPDIRYCVLASLDERFDAHLAQAENLQALFVALNDQVFEIRELAICTVGRLSSMNPAFVMPFLRKMLIQVRVWWPPLGVVGRARSCEHTLLWALYGEREEEEGEGLRRLVEATFGAKSPHVFPAW